jgi:hypothetical protein
MHRFQLLRCNIEHRILMKEASMSPKCQQQRHHLQNQQQQMQQRRKHKRQIIQQKVHDIPHTHDHEYMLASLKKPRTLEQAKHLNTLFHELFASESICQIKVEERYNEIIKDLLASNQNEEIDCLWKEKIAHRSMHQYIRHAIKYSHLDTLRLVVLKDENDDDGDCDGGSHLNLSQGHVHNRNQVQVPIRGPIKSLQTTLAISDLCILAMQFDRDVEMVKFILNDVSRYNPRLFRTNE